MRMFTKKKQLYNTFIIHSLTFISKYVAEESRACCSHRCDLHKSEKEREVLSLAIIKMESEMQWYQLIEWL